jgi:RNA polymerase primary sigma factor
MIVEEKVANYIRSSKKPLLSKERELELGKIINLYKNGKQKENAINELISHNLMLVIKIAFKYSRKTGIPLDDLIGAGNLGLSEAAANFNPEKFGKRFTTYAYYWISMRIMRFVYSSLDSVTVPLYVTELHYRYKKLIEKEHLNDKSLMEKLDINAAVLERIKFAGTTSISLDGPLITQNENETCLKDMMEDDNAVSPRAKAEEESEFSLLYASINELDETSRDIVLARYLSNDEGQLKKLGKKHNLSAERIRQISKKALDKLRRKISEKRLNG